MLTKHHWMFEQRSVSFFFCTESPDSERVKELDTLNKDFSLGSDCPNSTSTRTGFVGEQQRNYSHLQTRSSYTHTHIKRFPFISNSHTDRRRRAKRGGMTERENESNTYLT